MSTLPKNSTLLVRVMADLPDEASAIAFAGNVEARAAPHGCVLRLETKRYWKIPEWFEVSLTLMPDREIYFAFDHVVADFGEGWQRKDPSDDEKCAIWNPGHGDSFDSRVRWAVVECFLSPG